MSAMKPYEVDGTPCDLFIEGYCTDIEPKEAGCCGQEHCQRFSHLQRSKEKAELEGRIDILTEERDLARESQRNMHKRARSAEMALKIVCERILEEAPEAELLVFTAKEILAKANP